MNIAIKILLIIGCSAVCLSLWAQQKGVKKEAVKKIDTVKTTQKPKNFIPDVFLGHSDFTGGKIKKLLFDSLLKQGLTSHDTMGNEYKIRGFDFIYVERNLYEDEVANLKIIADYNYEYCIGDTVSKGVAETLYKRTKAGDTVYIEKVKLVKQIKGTSEYMPDSMRILGKSLKCVIIK